EGKREMHPIGMGVGRFEAISLDGTRVNNRHFGTLFRRLQRLGQLSDIVPVDRTDVAQAKGTENVTGIRLAPAQGLEVVVQRSKPGADGESIVIQDEN